jgi:hypothetical protein
LDGIVFAGGIVSRDSITDEKITAVIRASVMRQSGCRVSGSDVLTDLAVAGFIVLPLCDCGSGDVAERCRVCDNDE